MEDHKLKIISSIQDLIHLDLSELEAFQSRIHLTELAPGDSLLKPNQVCKKLSFLESGALFYTRYGSSGERLVVNLSIAGDWVLDHESFTRQSPSDINIVAQTQSLITSISIEALHELIEISNKYLVLGRLFSGSELRSYINRQDTSPDDRYLFLLNHRPELLQSFSLKDIAYFLRMTPETLSRIRRRIREA